MIERKLLHPWRWRLWMCLLPITLTLALIVALLMWVLEEIDRALEDTSEWAKEGEYVEIMPDGTERKLR